jgi:2-polyprenyl-3-methyl-5-hydroxy-6-metoxy-1,4-benzoquinol methylase
MTTTEEGDRPRAATPEFILPDRAAVQRAAEGDAMYSYAIYNYYGRGPIAAAKRRRFRRALEIGAAVRAGRVIDMGCADGLLIPSLARAYRHVAAIDVNPELVARSQRLARAVEADNVTTLCSAGLSTDELRAAIGPGYRLMFLLETLEHVGSQPDIWGSKVAFLRDCFSLMEPDGQIVISVPKMVGLSVLFKNVLQRTLRLGHDALTWRQLWRSAVLKDTDELEPLWDGHHVGFNHLKLDRHLQQSFTVHHRSESVISVFYRIGRLPTGAA